LARGARALSATVLPEVTASRDHLRGSGARTLLVYGDYECPYTRAAYRGIQAVEADGPAFRFVFRHFPLVEIHPHALAAAEASEAAAAQGEFWAMHDLLFRCQKALEPADLERYADDVGLDVERFRHELADHTHLERVEADRTAAVSVGAQGTPTIFLDGLPYQRSYQRAELRRALSE
jgi:protein-disulfide isomerase